MSLTLTNSNTKKRGGFTLVELLVSISMMAIVTASIFGYSRNSENRNNLNRAKERLMFEIQRAESLAMNNSQNPTDTRTDKGKWIQWGIATNDSGSYRIESRTCPSGAIDIDKGTCSPKTIIKLEDIKLPTGINLDTNSSDSSVYFLAPEPAVYKESGSKLSGSSAATFVLQYNHDSNKQITIKVNAIGQVNSN
jgi:prepilin-type N-terminal cleavage/methylation domain-containing protein